MNEFHFFYRFKLKTEAAGICGHLIFKSSRSTSDLFLNSLFSIGCFRSYSPSYFEIILSVMCSFLRRKAESCSSREIYVILPVALSNSLAHLNGSQTPVFSSCCVIMCVLCAFMAIFYFKKLLNKNTFVSFELVELCALIGGSDFR